MDRGRGDLEISLQVGLRWRASVDLGVGVNKRKILALKSGEGARCCGWDRHGLRCVIDWLHDTQGAVHDRKIHRYAHR